MREIADDLRNAFRKSNNALAKFIIFNLAVFIILNIVNVITQLSGTEPVFKTIMSFIQMPPQLPSLLIKPWTILTYGFVHLDFFHVLFNMLFLYWFGQLIMSYLGNQKFINIYILGVLAGGLFYTIFYNTFSFYNQNAEAFGAPLIGASAGVMAIVWAGATLMPNYTFHLLFLGPVKLKYIALFYFILSLIRITGFNAGGELAHVGGAIMGFIYIKQLRKGRDIGLFIEKIMSLGERIFKPKPFIKVTHSMSDSTSKATRSRSKETEYSSVSTNTTYFVNQDEIDAILDKISERGYEALTKEEKQKLFNASKK
ncbi:rhomboid family intramembrane serine protease [Aureibacter tunicatorum]|nr:rhomboid family intramembrane serine protease [Aureibacter tunicatorum]